MKKTVLTFGLISGGIMMVIMFATLPFTDSAWLQAHSMVIGYTTMVLSFMLVFFGIRSYRENIGGGTITFGRAFAVGILITVISTIFYVGTWEFMYFGVPSFGQKFMAMCVAHVKNSGASPEAIQTELNQLKYLDNPFINAALTFTEPFPVGLIITLISALILRKKRKSQVEDPTASAAEA
jgi:glucan phosphoethanolaminetransferase (alkaline phosphatase superfamily)